MGAPSQFRASSLKPSVSEVAVPNQAPWARMHLLHEDDDVPPNEIKEGRQYIRDSKKTGPWKASKAEGS